MRERGRERGGVREVMQEKIRSGKKRGGLE